MAAEIIRNFLILHGQAVGLARDPLATVISSKMSYVANILSYSFSSAFLSVNRYSYPTAACCLIRQLSEI